MKIASPLKTVPALLAIASLLTVFPPAFAQSVSSPAELALGGGSALLSGSASVFQNPANILVRTHRFERELMLGSVAMTFPTGNDPLLPLDAAQQIRDYFLPRAETSLRLASPTHMDNLATRGTLYNQRVAYQAVPVALVWRRDTSARSLAVRTRGVASFEMSTNWLQSQNATGTGSGTDVSDGWNRSLHERYQVLHEVSLGFAREVTMFNQWQAGLNTLLVGLAPKVVFAGMYSDMVYSSSITSDGTFLSRNARVHGHTTGPLTEIWNDVAGTNNAHGLPVANQHLGPGSNASIQGLGFGLDAGITYIIPLGDDISLSPHVRSPLRKSVRLSLSITDIGFVHYTASPARWQSSISEEQVDPPEPGSIGFTGKPGEMVRFLYASESARTLFEELIRAEDQPFTLQLPTRLQMGAAFHYMRLSASADLAYEHHAAHFLPRGWMVSAAAQMYLLRFLPLRASVQRETTGRLYYALGAGLDLGRLEVSAAARLYNDSDRQPEWLNRELAVMAMRFRW